MPAKKMISKFLQFVTAKKENQRNHLTDIEVIHTPDLPKRYKKARSVIASQHVQECADQLFDLGYNEFYSPLELLKDYDVKKYKHRISENYMSSRLAVCKRAMSFTLMKAKLI